MIYSFLKSQGHHIRVISSDLEENNRDLAVIGDVTEGV